LGRSGFFKADDGRKHTKDEQKNPHRNLSPAQDGSGVVLKLQIAIQVVYSRIRDGARRIGEYRQAAGAGEQDLIHR
jgi:hypothetical protein